MTWYQKFPQYYISLCYIVSVALFLVFIWDYLDWRLLVTWAVLQFLGMVGINMAYHHLICHKSYKTNTFWKIILTYIGGIATQSSPNEWALVHLTHHRYTDTERDPHTPNLSGNKIMGVLRAALPVFMNITITDNKVNLMAKKSFDDPIYRFFDYTHMLWFHGTWTGVYYFFGFDWLMIAFVFPIALAHIGETVINCFHFDMESVRRNAWFWNILIVGAGYHAKHHDTPRDYNTDWPVNKIIDMIKT